MLRCQNYKLYWVLRLNIKCNPILPIELLKWQQNLNVIYFLRNWVHDVWITKFVLHNSPKDLLVCTTESAQQSNMYVMVPRILFYVFHKHISLPFGPIHPWSPPSKELHGQSLQILCSGQCDQIGRFFALWNFYLAKLVLELMS